MGASSCDLALNRSLKKITCARVVENCSGTDHVSEGFLSVVCLIRKLELFVDRPGFLNL